MFVWKALCLFDPEGGEFEKCCLNLLPLKDSRPGFEHGAGEKERNIIPEGFGNLLQHIK